jgi:hypothetical protein
LVTVEVILEQNIDPGWVSSTPHAYTWAV